MATRRRHPRFPFNSQLEICRAGTSSGWVVARGRNVSAGGVGFESALPVSVGERLRIAMTNAEERVTTEIVVCHVRPREGRYLIGCSNE